MTVASTTFTLVGLGVFIVAVLIYFSWLGSQLGASVFSLNVGTTYIPLLRHTGAVHCYDTGNGGCPTRGDETAFMESTVGYLSGSPITATSKALYSCLPRAGVLVNQSLVTLHKSECAAHKLQSQRLGYLFDTALDVPAASTPASMLYRCGLNQDMLLTDDVRECMLKGYSKPDALGYVASAGHGAALRLVRACEVAARHCGEDDVLSSCALLIASCSNLPDSVALPISPEALKSARAKLDDNNDGHVTPSEIDAALKISK